ncbi:transposase, partial [Serratia marcescens]|uniref:transposase n=1 Tax=Serratia marcescens TaxID=615 RepID=UPI0023DD729E
MTGLEVSFYHVWKSVFVLCAVPGIGNVTIVELLSEVGSLTQYEHPRQLIKLAGLTLRENSSG